MKTEPKTIINTFIKSFESGYSSSVSGFDDLQAGREVAITHLNLENDTLKELLEVSITASSTQLLNQKIEKNNQLISELENLILEGV